MSDLAELRIQRMPVSQNSKCEGCVHYDGNAAAKGGACEVGQQPQLCGSGAERKYGYAPLDELGPDEIDDLATPSLVGSVGAMNEHGNIEKTIAMKRVVLGDEDLSIAKRIHGELIGKLSKSIGYAQGIVSASCGAELYTQRNEQEPTMYLVAKALRDLHMAPRKQRKYDLEDVLDFLKSSKMDVKDEDYAAAGIAKAEMKFSDGKSVQYDGKKQAAGIAALKQQDAAAKKTSSRGASPFANGQKPNLSGTQSMTGQVRKGETPNVRKLESDVPFVKRPR